MSHEWNCRCSRCEADEAKCDGDDPGERDDAARYGGGAREASEGEE